MEDEEAAAGTPRSGSHRTLPVLWNAAAGTGDLVPGEIERLLGEAGTSAVVHSVEPGQLGAATAAAAREATPMLGIAGGDGSMQTAAAELVGSDTVMAPLPTGTLNHFARRLGIPDLETAAAAVAAGATRRMPVGRLGSLTFLNTATFGEYARVVSTRERLRRWLPKWPAAGLAAARALLRLRSLEVELELDGEVSSYSTPLVWVGVGTGSFPFPHEVEPGWEAVLEVAVFQPESLGSQALFILRYARSGGGGERPGDDPAVEIRRARALRLRAGHPVGVTVDGEVHRLDPPLAVDLQQRALRVIVAKE